MRPLLIILSLLVLIPISMALSGTGGGYSIEGHVGSAGGSQDASGLNVSVINTLAVKESGSTRLYGGIFCILNRPPTIVQASITPSSANGTQTVTIGAVIGDNDTDNVRLKAYNGTDKGTLLCTGATLGSNGNSSCSFTASDAGCSAGTCNIYMYGEDLNNECEGSSFSEPSILSFIYDTAFPSIFNPVPNTTDVGYTKQGANFRINFSYTELNPKNYSVEIYNSSTQICYNTSTSMTGGEGINVSTTCDVSGSVTEGYYTYRMTVVDTVLQLTQNTQTDAVLIDNTQPTGTLTVNPTVNVSGTSYAKGVIPLNATGSDVSSGISHIDWYYDSTRIGGDGSSPYGIDWDTSTAPDGTYNITARVYDRSGNTRTVG